MKCACERGTRSKVVASFTTALSSQYHLGHAKHSGKDAVALDVSVMNSKKIVGKSLFSESNALQRCICIDLSWRCMRNPLQQDRGSPTRKEENYPKSQQLSLQRKSENSDLRGRVKCSKLSKTGEFLGLRFDFFPR